jgi:hypothetical protein
LLYSHGNDARCDIVLLDKGSLEKLSR